mmetsp:Transcript_68089/g.197313  ORF Transcript_68089/g.197313 Transcript_68089/m.197313 type:complete len:355 (-) Transcript_68089:18-1082(-)
MEPGSVCGSPTRGRGLPWRRSAAGAAAETACGLGEPLAQFRLERPAEVAGVGHRRQRIGLEQRRPGAERLLELVEAASGASLRRLGGDGSPGAPPLPKPGARAQEVPSPAGAGGRAGGARGADGATGAGSGAGAGPRPWWRQGAAASARRVCLRLRLRRRHVGLPLGAMDCEAVEHHLLALEVVEDPLGVLQEQRLSVRPQQLQQFGVLGARLPASDEGVLGRLAGERHLAEDIHLVHRAIAWRGRLPRHRRAPGRRPLRAGIQARRLIPLRSVSGRRAAQVAPGDGSGGLLLHMVGQPLNVAEHRLHALEGRDREPPRVGLGLIAIEPLPERSRSGGAAGTRTGRQGHGAYDH